MPISPETYRWLTSAAAQPWLESAAGLLRSEGILVASKRLRKSLSQEQAAGVLGQAQLRERAQRKFSQASAMFFTDLGLQQATSEIVANYKAKHFPRDIPVLDLCCGIGGDLVSLARRGPATGIDRDESAAFCAMANCQSLQLLAADVQIADVTKLSLDSSTWIHLDPDRRPQGHRTTSVALHEPNDDFLSQLMQTTQGGAIKLAPATDVPSAWEGACTLEWISHHRECKQQVAWFGEAATHRAPRCATKLDRDGFSHSIEGDHKPVTLPMATGIESFVYEPDPAVIASGLVGNLAFRHGLASVAPGIAYLTSEQRLKDPLLATFAVIEVLPLDLKQLKATLGALGVGRLEIKKRGVALSPEQLRRKLHCQGDRDATLLITPHQDKTLAVICKRIH